MFEISRRSFIAIASGLGAGTRFLPSLLVGRLGLAPGIQLYAVRDPLSQNPLGTLKTLRAIGFREVEAAGFGKYSAAEFGRMISDSGLACPSAHLPFVSATNLSPLFDDAHALGASYVVSSFLRPLSGFGNDRSAYPLPKLGVVGFQRTAARMNQIGRAARDAGLQYAYHNHNFEFERLPDGSCGYDLLLRETDQSVVKFEVDCGWMVVAGANPVQYFRSYPGRFRMLHVKDFKPTRPTTELLGSDRPYGIELGNGFIDYKPIFAAAKLAGIQHAFAEQEEPYSESELASAKVSYQFLNTLLHIESAQ